MKPMHWTDCTRQPYVRFLGITAFMIAAFTITALLSLPTLARSTGPDGVDSIPDTEADRVLGAPDFTTVNPATSATQLFNPADVAIASDGRIFVADHSNNRVISWPNAFDFTNGQAADLAFGPSDLVSTGGGLDQRHLTAAEGVATDADGNLWVADTFSNRLVRFSPPFVTGMNANLVLGQANYTSGGINRNSSPAANTLSSPHGMVFDNEGRLYVADTNNHRVLRFAPPLSDGMVADLVLGQADFASTLQNRGNQGGAVPTASSLWSPISVAIDSAGRVYVADRDNNRVVRYNTPLSNGMDASDFIGKPSAVAESTLIDTCEDNPNNIFTPQVTAADLSEPWDIAFNAVDDLVVADRCFHRVLIFQDPFGTDSTADFVYGQADFISSKSNRNQSQPANNTLNNPNGLTVDSNGAIYVADWSNHRLLAFDVPVPTATDTPVPSTPTNTPQAGAPTNTPTAPNPATGDAFEEDDTCAQAKAIAVSGAIQDHTFHDVGDKDWIKFTAVVNKTYIIEVENIGSASDAEINLFDTCASAPGGLGQHAFGSKVTLQWDSSKAGDYFVQIVQFDPSFFGTNANYRVSIKEDTQAPAEPENVRCISINPTTLGVQWKKVQDRDVKRYVIQYAGTPAGNINVAGADTTFGEIPSLTTGQTYNVIVRALDFSNNASTPSLSLPCIVQTPADITVPALTVEAPTGNTVTTSGNLLTFTGKASDSGGNLSRVLVNNLTASSSSFDFSLTGSSDDFRVENVQLAVGDNQIEISVFDAAGNSSKKALTVKRLGIAKGAVIIIAGRNETNSLQSNIYNAANRAFRIFRSAGFSEDTIYYLAPLAQDADNDGQADDVDKPSTPSEVQNAIVTWAKDKVGPDQPLFVYMIDHGFVDKYCVDGCNSPGFITPASLNEWLSQLETSSQVNQVNVVIEACLSGSFITRANGNGNDPNSLAKPGRVIITSTSDDKNAYASATGAYFSDAFFSCIADSQDLKTCFEQGKSAVSTLGVNQFPQMDDNGDATYVAAQDGEVAKLRFVTRFFAATRPSISSAAVERSGANGVLTARVEEGAEAIDVVWAAVYPPGFAEPGDATITPTLNLNVPTLQLQPDPTTPGKYTFAYNNGFTAAGDYRVVFYAQDKAGIHAQPRLPGGAMVYLPLVTR